MLKELPACTLLSLAEMFGSQQLLSCLYGAEIAMKCGTWEQQNIQSILVGLTLGCLWDPLCWWDHQIIVKTISVDY